MRISVYLNDFVGVNFAYAKHHIEFLLNEAKLLKLIFKIYYVLLILCKLPHYCNKYALLWNNQS